MIKNKRISRRHSCDLRDCLSDNLLAVGFGAGEGILMGESQTRRIPASVPTFFPRGGATDRIFKGEEPEMIQGRLEISRRRRRRYQDKVNCMTFLPVPSGSGLWVMGGLLPFDYLANEACRE